MENKLDTMVMHSNTLKCNYSSQEYGAHVNEVKELNPVKSIIISAAKIYQEEEVSKKSDHLQ